MIGRVFGKWKVEKLDGVYAQPDGTKRKKWICECECGVTQSHWGNSLLSKNGSRSCKDCARKTQGKFQQVGGITSDVWYRIISNAKARGYEVKIAQKYAWEVYLKQDGLCALSGRPITLPKYQKERGVCGASLDRIDSSRPYEEGNVQWIHKDVNKMKNKFDEKYFVELCRAIANHAN